MSTLLSAQSISIDLTSGTLFEGISFTLQKGNRVGLIGHNGCGKSTLLKVLSQQISDHTGQISQANHCVIAHIEQHLPTHLASVSLLDALSDQLPSASKLEEQWRAEALLVEMGFSEHQWNHEAGQLSGGQHMRLLLARALIKQPDLLLLDEPSNHLDLPTLLWLENFLLNWKGSFVLVSHDQRLLDKVTNTTWVMRDKTLYHFDLACSEARQALSEKDKTDEQRRNVEQKEIDRIAKSAKRLAEWGKVYDNEDLARKAKHMEKRKERLQENQTQLGEGSPWRLTLSGETLPANRLMDLRDVAVTPALDAPRLFQLVDKQIKSGERIAILGQNGCGKSSLLRLLFARYQFNQSQESSALDTDFVFHAQCRLGYYDQSLEQLHDHDSLLEALRPFAPLTDETRKMALISAGFAYQRHSQPVVELSGGERARLLFIGLSLAKYHLLFLDEPTNHLDMEGKQELFDTLNQFQGGLMVVSHDRELIETCCNRYWLIVDGVFEEHTDLEQVYRLLGNSGSTAKELGGNTSGSEQSATAAGESVPLFDEETLLESLFELEQLLEDDMNRKAKHQKPALQEEWKAKIRQINEQLALE
ncbi:ABC-F family ATP-binding cassette domain-containing protein [Vibrio sp. T187]|uniref:ABC-F family ATP-binding cassette domain-containing protein n=1 Tax=Vibrio TaxID=662 RepID=UPI0010C9CF6C|nr:MULTISPECIES: ABC-F family ATP-binding cassette domain-containing protein [Vibrio]MBW3695809.1 ABC-F family ATP-binding cassette domain-containing protein [Vibrio sp. T187]